MRCRTQLVSAGLLAVVLSGGILADAFPASLSVLDAGVAGTVASHAAVAPPKEPATRIPTHTHANGPTVTAAPRPVQLWPPGAEAVFVQGPPGGGCVTTKNTQAGAMQFCCPSALQDPLALVQPTDRTDVTGCPFRIYDETYNFGNAQLAVHPTNGRDMVFVSLHSSPDPSGPTPRSRTPDQQTHTAFTSTTQGVRWQDEPIPCGGGGSSPGLGVYGEAGSAVMDPHGSVYLAYLWSTAGTNSSYGATIGLYKAAPLETYRTTLCEAYSDAAVIESRTSTNPIPRVNLVFVPPYVPPPPTNATAGNLTGGPATSEEIGEKAVQTWNRTEERVVAVWFERATSDPWGPRGYPGWIDAAITDTGNVNEWARLNETALIGPCLEGSNPVAWNGNVYVACVVDKGYGHRSDARIGDVDLWRIDPRTGKTDLVSPTPLVGGRPLLAVTSDGYFAIATTRLDSPDAGASVTMAFGWYGVTWQPIGDLGRVLHVLAGTRPVYDAGLTALALSEKYKLAALVYMEWQQPLDPENPPLPSPPDPSNPTAVRQQITDYRKIIAVADACGAFPLAAAELQLGTGYDAYNYDAYVQRPSVFDDFQDGLVPYRDAGGQDLWHFAVNDYGSMQYGTVLTSAIPSSCPIVPPPLPPPVAPVAQALSFTSGTNLIVGSTVGVAAAAMVLYLLTVKRRVATSVAAEDK